MVKKINHEKRNQISRGGMNSVVAEPEERSEKRLMAEDRAMKRFQKIREKRQKPGCLQIEAALFSSNKPALVELIKKARTK